MAGDQSYFEKREAQERLAAERTHGKAREAHEQMAERYRHLASLAEIGEPALATVDGAAAAQPGLQGVLPTPANADGR